MCTFEKLSKKYHLWIHVVYSRKNWIWFERNVHIIHKKLFHQVNLKYLYIIVYWTYENVIEYAISSSDLAWFMLECLTGVGQLCMAHFLAFMERADDIGSWPAAWSYVPVQSSSCSLRVLYKTLVVGKDTY